MIEQPKLNLTTRSGERKPCQGIKDSMSSTAFSPCSRANVIQANLNSSNTDGSFTMVDSNSSLIPYEILMIAQVNK